MRFSQIGLAWLSALSVCAAQTPLLARNNSTTAKQPNVLFIITDDQDLHLNSLDYLPKVKKYLSDEGTSFTHHYCTIALCCPSRVSLLTGKAAHNTNVTDVKPPYGGYPKFISQGLNNDYLPLWLQEAGYATYYVGKLMNSHNVTNYAHPHAAGWDGNEFLLDPYTYLYRRPAFQRNLAPPVIYNHSYLGDVLADKASGFLDDALKGDKPWFLGVAPVAPHADSNATNGFGPPVPPPRFEHLFPNATVPRTPNFNPEKASGASWIKQLPRQNQTVVDYNDYYYRRRLQTLQTVDELVEELVTKLDKAGQLDNTFIVYTADNGYHIGQHRLLPGKACGYEEDINVPFIMRGPGIPKGAVSDVVSSHTDLAPTFLTFAGAPLRPEFDGSPIPFTAAAIAGAEKKKREHVNVEFWGVGLTEGVYGTTYANNTYKALRLAGEAHNLYYAVWCTNEHELYDLHQDPGQLDNLLTSNGTQTLYGRPLAQVVNRLDALLFVLKTCKQDACRRPWKQLQPTARVHSLEQALAAQYDAFYDGFKDKVTFSECALGYLASAEGAVFNASQLITRDDGSRWEDWV